jgi:hypothetical protein
MFELHDIPSKTTTGMMYIEQPRQVPWIKIETHLRWLLILVDGALSVRELLSKGLPHVELGSFDQLEAEGLISKQVSEQPLLAVVTATPPPKIVLATARFDILDLILDASMQDFELRCWVDQFEQSHNLDDLIAAYQRFCAQVGQQHPRLQQQITSILAL